MAAITTANVTLLDSENYSVGTASGKLVEHRIRVSIALTAQGGTAGDIPAAVLGYAQIYRVSLIMFLTAGPANANVGVTIDAYASTNNILTFTATDAATGAANVTGTLYIEVWGRSV